MKEHCDSSKNQICKRIIWVLIIVLVIVPLGMIGFYIGVFYNGQLSSDASDWGAFGAYFGGIAGWMAFVGVLLTLGITRDQNKDNSERDLFFKMLELYGAKFNNVEYGVERGAEAFKKYTEKANLYLKHVILYNYIIESIKEGKDINALDNLFYNTYNIKHIQSPITDIINRAMGVNIQNPLKAIKTELEENRIPIIKGYDISSFVREMLKDKPLSIENIYVYIRKAADIIYDEYGHVLGHYFRNFYYVMKTTDTFNGKNSKNYKPLLRAQISRYEIAMNVYNALSSRSGVSMIEYLESYQIFKDLYDKDIFLFELSKEEDLLSELLNKSKEYLRNKERI